MRLPRDLSGEDLATLLRRHYDYRIVRQRGSHMTLTRTVGDVTHSVTVPRHRAIQMGTLSGILAAVAAHLDVAQVDVRGDLFGD